MPRLEILGARAASLVAPLVQGIKTGGEAALEVVTRTFYSGREAVVRRPDGKELRYAPYNPAVDPDGIVFGDDGSVLSPIDEFNTDAGAGLCGEYDAGSLASIPGTYVEGEVILDGIVAAAKMAWSPEREDPEEGSSRFRDWVYPETGAVAPITTTDHGTAAGPGAAPFWPDTAAPEPGAPPASIERAKGAARFAFWGGDPAVDMPEVLVERETSPGSGLFEPLKDARGRPASSRDGAVVLTYVPDPIDADAPARHLYGAVFQAVPPDPFLFDDAMRPYSLPLGLYRLRAEGRAMGPAGLVDYEVTSGAFEVVVAALGPGSAASKGSGELAITALLGAAPGLRALREGVSDKDVPLPGPWTVTVSISGGAMKSGSVAPDASGHGALPLAAADLSGAIAVDVRDPAGNGGALLLP